MKDKLYNNLESILEKVGLIVLTLVVLAAGYALIKALILS